MNRILINEVLNEVKDNLSVYKINKDIALLLDSNYDNSVFNIENSNVNILLLANSNINIKFNLNNSSLDLNIFSYDGNNNFIDVKLNNESKINIYNAKIANLESNIKININHNSSNTLSNVYNCVVTKDDGYSNIEVISKVFKDSKLCNVNQDSKIITLNNTNKNKINPVLLIDCYDAIAKHSAFIGKFNEDELFYLQTRGLDKKKAYNLLLKGFLIGIMNITVDEKEMLEDKLNI